MCNKLFYIILSINIFLGMFSVKAQTDTTINNTVSPSTDLVITSETPVVKEKQLNRKSPRKAALFSTALPGLGQVYNGRYWKVPIIYAIGGSLGYLIYYNNQGFNFYKNQFNEVFAQNSLDSRLSAIRFERDGYRRNRDFCIIISALVYGLNIVEAYVDAHLMEFDLSDDLSLQIAPQINLIPNTNQFSQGISLKFNLRR